MAREHDEGGNRRVRRALCRGAVPLMVAGWMAVGQGPGAPADAVSAQSASQRAYSDYQVLFEFTEDDIPGGSSNDLITVIFSNRSVEGATPPVPLFGEDILEEFSFSASNVARGQIRFSRRVRDKSFVNARYIRVVNHGSDGWAGERISLTVDGEPILRNVGMFPRRGSGPRGAIERFNPREWSSRTYWESELQQYRSARK